MRQIQQTAEEQIRFPLALPTRLNIIFRGKLISSLGNKIQYLAISINYNFTNLVNFRSFLLKIWLNERDIFSESGPCWQCLYCLSIQRRLYQITTQISIHICTYWIIDFIILPICVRAVRVKLKFLYFTLHFHGIFMRPIFLVL